MSHILVHAGTSTPVPLPFHTTYTRDDNGETHPATIHSFREPRRSPISQFSERGSVAVSYAGGPPCYGSDPATFELEIITEAQFMERQDHA